MKKRSVLRILLSALLLFASLSVNSKPMLSPNKKIGVEVRGDGLMVQYNGSDLYSMPALGISTTNHQGAVTFVSAKKTGKINSQYTMLSGKRRECSNSGNEYLLTYRYGDGNELALRLRVYNDGIAIRYEIENLKREKIVLERTTYEIPNGTKRWIQRWSEGYEDFFPLSTRGDDGNNRKWGFPSLVEYREGVFTLFSESNIERRQSASWLTNKLDPEQYMVCHDKNDVLLDGSWHTPWRVAIIGSLSDVVESTLVTDVAEECKINNTSWIKPGVVSWIYWANNHGSNDLNIIKKYVDLAVALKLPYTLIDAEWDEMKDGNSILDAVNYSKSKGIKPMIWYNSSVGWINGAPGPKFRLNDLLHREQEFQWCQYIGVVGVKIDFFSGDNQANMDYMLDLLESASHYHLLVNFHGATIPRGWQRTYPHLLTTEAVYGAEWYNNNGVLTNKAACHNATLPFTRNVIGPMDYTPCAFSDSQHPHITTHGHELALTVLFESGLQHLADRPESFLAQPREVQEFFGDLPAAWDDTKLISGYPGEYVALARRSGERWFIAIINGTDSPKEISLDWSRIAKKPLRGKMYGDSGDSQSPWMIKDIDALPEKVTLMARGGCVLLTN